jgi:hypothetical protein
MAKRGATSAAPSETPNIIRAMRIRKLLCRPNFWTAERPFKLPLILGDVGTRMTIVILVYRGLFLHSPVPLDAGTKSALDQIGAVRAIVAPSKAHHLVRR